MSVLAILAHPDDETLRCGGTLALLARRGMQVHLLTFTRGQAGSCGDPPLCTRDELPAVRERELHCACAALGVASPILLDYRDGALDAVNEAEAVAHVMTLIEVTHPQILLTWPPDGLSGHPDHMAVSRWADRAFVQATSLGSVAPAALYHLTMPHSMAETLGLTHLHAVPDDEVTLTVNVTPAWSQKMAAIHCHRTQLGESPILSAPDDRQRLFLGREYFVLRAARPGKRDVLAELLAE